MGFGIGSRMKTTYMNLRMRDKIISLNFGVIAIITIVIGYYSYSTYSERLLEGIRIVNLRDTRQIGKTIELIQKDIAGLSTFICLNDFIQDVILSDESQLAGADVSRSIEFLSNTLVSNDAISFISIYGSNGFQYYVSTDFSTGIGSLDAVRNTEIYRKAEALRGRPIWAPVLDTDGFIMDNKARKVAMFRTILDLDTYTTQGFLMIAVNLSTISRIYRENLEIPGSLFFVLDEDYSVILPSENSDQALRVVDQIKQYLEPPDGGRVVDVNGNKMLLTSSRVDTSGWTVLYLVPMSEVLTPATAIIRTTVLVVVLCLAAGLLLSMWTSSVLTSPLKRLLESMEKVKQGSFKETFDFQYHDEIGQLGDMFNAMIAEINNLINRVYKLQLEEKEAQLKALEAQINPHFLYNTLDTIYWKAERAGNKDISEMAFALGSLFRLTLHKGDTLIPVAREKELVEYYMMLQSIRYQDKMCYQILIEEGVLGFLIPKLTLQPFVENAVVHATESSDKTTTITVTGQRVGDRIRFEIADDGVGMDKDTLERALSATAPLSRSLRLHGYGIYNVNERLSLYFGEDYSLNIESKLGSGTRVELLVPAVSSPTESD